MSQHTQALVLCALFAAAGTLSVPTPAAAQTGNPGNGRTFYRDVLPIVQEKCQLCHRPGQIGSFSMLTYEDTRGYARAIKKRVLAREMPPWFADPSVGHFSNDPSLSKQQIETLVAWVNGGASEGNPKDAPAPVAWPADGWRIQPDAIVKGAAYPVPKEGVLDWMYIPVPMPFKEDTWVSSMELRPGADASVTHHYCVMIVPKLKNAKYGEPTPMMELGVTLGGTPSGGFEGCYETGQGAFDYRPYQAARLIPGNSDMVFQMHYAPRGKKAVVDQPQVGFTIAKGKPAKQFMFLNIGGGTRIDIPPNEPNYKAPVQEAQLNVDAKIVWYQGHAHYRAKEMRFGFVFPDGRTEEALHLKWHPYWQQVYYPTTPIEAPAGTILRIEGWYDNSARNRFNPDPNARVPFGVQATEEMLFPTFGVVVDVAGDPSPRNVVKPTARADELFNVVEGPKSAAQAAPGSGVKNETARAERP